MRKLLHALLLLPPCLLIASGCSRDKKPEGYQGSVLEDLPFVYRMTVQQGNILTKETVDRLELGMTKNQVQFLLGTPVLVDFFHRDRWDYTYTLQRGHQPMETRYLTLFFKDEQLARIEGDFRPDPDRAQSSEPEQVMVSVPDHEERKGFITRGLESIGLERKD